MPVLGLLDTTHWLDFLPHCQSPRSSCRGPGENRASGRAARELCCTCCAAASGVSRRCLRVARRGRPKQWPTARGALRTGGPPRGAGDADAATCPVVGVAASPCPPAHRTPRQPDDCAAVANERGGFPDRWPVRDGCQRALDPPSLAKEGGLCSPTRAANCQPRARLRCGGANERRRGGGVRTSRAASATLPPRLFPQPRSVGTVRATLLLTPPPPQRTRALLGLCHAPGNTSVLVMRTGQGGRRTAHAPSA